MKEFKFKINDLELRSCDECLIQQSKNHKTAEILYHQLDDSGKTYCFTLAYWIAQGDGFDLKFVGDRPFVYGDKKDFWILAKMGQQLLDEYFNDED